MWGRVGAVGKGAGQRRRQAAITVGKDRRESVVRAKRLRRADPSEHGDDGDAMQLGTAGMDDEAAYKALEDNTVAAVHNLRNLYTFLAAQLDLLNFLLIC
jgi:importin subunit alpha-1